MKHSLINITPLFRIGSVQEKVYTEIIAGQTFDQIMKKLKTRRLALCNVLFVIKKKTGIRCRSNEELFRRILAGETKKADPSGAEELKGEAKKLGIILSDSPSLSSTDADLVKDMDDIDIAYNILQNKILKCGAMFGMSTIVKRIVSQAVGEIKILVQVAHGDKKE